MMTSFGREVNAGDIVEGIIICAGGAVSSDGGERRLAWVTISVVFVWGGLFDDRVVPSCEDELSL